MSCRSLVVDRCSVLGCPFVSNLVPFGTRKVVSEIDKLSNGASDRFQVRREEDDRETSRLHATYKNRH